MLESLIVEPMREDFILWRCLNGGPLNRQNIDAPSLKPEVDWPKARARNIPLLEKLTRTYGACAILARDGDDVVGSLRFYPKALFSFGASGTSFCMQQRWPAGPPDDIAACEFPSLEALGDKTIFVHCLMIALPLGEPDRYRRKGLATRLAYGLVCWAKEKGWSSIEANAYEELPMLYAISGAAGRRFWERLGFRMIHQDTEPAIGGELLEKLRQDATAAGLHPENVANRYRMRLEMTVR
jgi:GNAT superfamily N-acetyltransferase